MKRTLNQSCYNCTFYKPSEEKCKYCGDMRELNATLLSCDYYKASRWIKNRHNGVIKQVLDKQQHFYQIKGKVVTKAEHKIYKDLKNDTDRK